MPAETVSKGACQICAGAVLEELEDFRNLPRVTSDCVPFRSGGRLLVCRHCGAAQSPLDAQWFGEIAEIYDRYQIFHQSGGMDQYVVDPRSNQFKTRSSVLAERLATVPAVPSAGRVIDIGCGTGVMLKALAHCGTWVLNGLDLDTRSLPLLESIPRFDTLHTCPLAEVPGQFDLVTMIHSLEHFPDPLAVLRDLRSKVATGGALFIQVPNAEANPFEYLVADHMVHFSPATLATLVRRAGFAIDCLSTSWVSKELSLVARPGAATDAAGAEATRMTLATSQVSWLHSFVEQADRASRETTQFGLFGTSIAATWLCEALGQRVQFFVDEDVNRQGRTHLGRSILSPAQVSPDSLVYIALVPEIARQVAPRLRSSRLSCRLPPDVSGGNGEATNYFWLDAGTAGFGVAD